MFDGKLAIYVHRSCNCSMEAWDVLWNYPEYSTETLSEIFEKEVQVKLELFDKFINFLIISNQINVTNTFWIPKWWKNENNMKKYANSALKIEGVIEQIAMLNVTAINKTTISPPVSTRFDEILTINSNIIVRGFFLNGAKLLEINLMHDTQEGDKDVGSTSLKIIVDCNNNENIIFNTYDVINFC
uniref:Uncharacterized protein n=1 Tax=Meloidogyne hapla TaxID=6305 RepID=A0A1I8B5Y3_MELHA